MPDLTTPIYFETSPGDGVRDREPCYYVLSASGLYIGRNTEFFQSLVPARRWPVELETQDSKLQLRYPVLDGKQLAAVCGFFRHVAAMHGAEAIALLVLDRETGRLRTFVPHQLATIGKTWSGSVYPIGVRYDSPYLDAARHVIIGDIHSHAHEAAYASSIDVADEQFRTGLHVVAGQVDRDPPQWHAEYVVDGTRFGVEPEAVLDLDGCSNESGHYPPKWMRRLTIDRNWNARPATHSSGGAGVASRSASIMTGGRS